MEHELAEPFRRCLNALPADDPWPLLVQSGFLDVLRAPGDGGAGLDLDAARGIIVEAGRIGGPDRLTATLLTRSVSATAIDIVDAEISLTGLGVPADTARALAAAGTASEMAGTMAAVLDLTLGYTLTRRHFGRPIANFQAVQQQLAVMAEEVAAADMAVQSAMRGPPLALSIEAAAIAKIRAGQAAAIVAATAHAIHGAIGMSLEHPLHRFTRKLHDGRLAYGGEAWWARRLGTWAIDSTEPFLALARRF